jgi:Sulfotransferase family
VSRPDPVRVDDLRNPQFLPDARPILDVLAEHGKTMSLEPDVLCAAAEEQTGLATWGDGAFRERLDVLCRSLREEVPLNSVGVALTYESLLQPLRNRLLIEDLIAKHPEIEDVPIERAIIVCGLPRTGTTHLHNLLSSDPALRHLPYWESLEPLPPPNEVGAPREPAPRVARCAAACDMLDLTMPLFKRMHEMTVDHAHEEIQLLAIDVAGMFYETTALMTGWRDHYKASDQTPSYRYLRRVLQVLTWQRGGTRWVLKSPQHLEQFGPLVSTFPDATFVLTHRDPVAVTASLVTMLGYTARLRVDHPDPIAIGEYWSARVEDLLLGCVRDRDLLPADQSLDVRFDDFMADEDGLVHAIYDIAGQPYGDEVRAAMSAFMQAHPRGRHGTIEYDLAEFGIDPEERRRALRAYTERFGV